MINNTWNIIAAVLLLLAVNASAQTKNEIFSAQHPNGIFVMLSTKVQDTFISSIERQTKGGAWVQTAQVVKPTTRDAFQHGLKRYAAVFPDYPVPSPEEQGKIWERIGKYGLTDSLSLWAASPTVLLALGAAYLDTAVAPNTYNYKVTIKDEAGKIVSTGVSRPLTYPSPVTFGKISFMNYRAGADYIFSEWYAKPPLPNQVRVLRADVNIGTFEAVAPVKGFIKRNDSLFVFIKDTAVSAAVQYRYYLEPINLFEYSGTPSDTVQMTNWDITSVVLQEFTVTNVDSGNAIRLKYKITDPGLVSVVKIYRSIEADKGYVLLAEVPPVRREYLDENAVPMQKYYYRLKFADMYGNETGLSVKGFATYSSEDQPFAPNFFAAEGTPKGVLLQWTCYDKNIDGFYIHRNDGTLPLLEMIAPMIRLKADSVYTYLDSSKTLKGNRFYSYSLRTESTSHVKSGFSDTLSARPLFPTSPLAPVDVSVSAESSGIRLHWTDVSGVDEDVIGYTVYRKEKSTHSEYVKITPSVLSVGHNYFVDTAFAAGVEYEYAVTSKDMFGGESSMAGFITAMKSATVPAAPGEVKLYPKDNSILLRWDPIESGIDEYRIYRYMRGAAPVRIGTLKHNADPEFTDAKVEKGRLYFYYITTKNSQGNESVPGPESSVRFGW